jgi:hypothetical protein
VRRLYLSHINKAWEGLNVLSCIDAYHGRRHDLVYTSGEWYRALDLWNLFDGICFDKGGNVVFIQIKTNAWATEEPIFDFMRYKKNIKVLSINVYKKKGRWDVKVRAYCMTQIHKYFNMDDINKKQ